MEEYSYTLADDYILRIDDLLNDGDFVGAKKLLEEILEIEPDLGRAHNTLGWIYFQKLDKYKLAEYHFKLAIKFDPELPFSYRNYIFLLSYLNRYEELVDLVNAYIDVPGLEKDVLYGEQGLALEYLGRYEAARSAFTLARKYATKEERIAAIKSSLARIEEKSKLFSNSKGFLRKAFAAVW